MNQKHLLRFIKRTIREDADTVCRYVDGKPQTLRDMFNELGVSAYDLRRGFTVISNESFGIISKMRTLKVLNFPSPEFLSKTDSSTSKSVDLLDVRAGSEVYHRFDKFNSKYSPLGNPILREIYIKTNNQMNGKYFADIIKEVAEDLEESKYQHAEV